jgi:predicted dehydrogenase
MSSDRRDFLKKVAAGTAGISVGASAAGKSGALGSTAGMPARSYRRILGANDRIHVAIVGLGRRLVGFVDPVSDEKNNVELRYLCDVMLRQRESAAERFSTLVPNKPRLENDLRRVIEDPQVDLLINATPDHWHAPGTILALAGGKHVYVEKPATHNMQENLLIVAAQKKYGGLVQMGVQQRSSSHTMEIIGEIHRGAIGTPYKAVGFYSNNRGEVPVQEAAPVPEGLDWDLFQGPAPRRAYTRETWDYNWHWYGWDYGTAETGNNATHEFDVARWALQVEYPVRVDVEAGKRHFPGDGWEMYDTMEVTFRYAGDKVIVWDGKSRNAYPTYGSGRGTIIYGTEGTVYVDRDGYRLHDRSGKLVRDSRSGGQEAGTALGGGGEMSTAHVVNLLDAIRGKTALKAPIEEGIISMSMVHYSNIAYRIRKGFDVDDASGKIYDREAMQLWGREYEPGWEPRI